ncbi:5-formyltetrahydrofolate cyclo-ligase [Pedobacter sp. HMF7647]|uniref:5-formyltetrahydrofolate cyclo-ligase n=1 Tax=Hufsiella arboris TaxID=2695275 RepID=A0A7K1Y569_9SPHI|nr:5-formyltetrahydrofolate cyclo-ligase [Hufsiella arboris]MXV49733.1 5-formyltetrahydrofolate cyclo-ligase [Hufsiella arboris]
MNKAELRKSYLEKRRALSEMERGALSVQILANFKTLDFTVIRYFHTYYPMIGRSEFDTLILTDWLKKSYPEVILVLPQSNLETGTMQHVVWNSETRLAMNSWGITEPENGRVVDPVKIDAVLIPLLAYDKKGNRVGYGKGFYDRFLIECRTGVLKIGVSFFGSEDEIQDADDHDIPLDLCITPYEIRKF